MTTDPGDPTEVPTPDVDVCERCGGTYAGAFDERIYGPWLERHNRRPHDEEVPGAPS